ncbi:MAG: right-handed parallel beta-helix repeat-containing protein, partial [Candidatus Micrarchaeia archaeon]
MNINNCAALNASNSYTLTQSVQTNGSTCFNVTGADVALDCAGFSITGNNTLDTFGIYSSQFNTTVRNCNISSFADGIYFDGADNGTIDNSNATITDYFSPAGNGYGIYLNNNANYNRITRGQATASSNRAIFINSSSSNTLSNLTATTTLGKAIYLSESSSNTLSN